MSTVIVKKYTPRISVPVSVEELAESIWQLPYKERESLEDVMEQEFVRRVLRRAKDIPRLRKEKKLLSFQDIQQTFAR